MPGLEPQRTNSSGTASFLSAHSSSAAKQRANRSNQACPILQSNQRPPGHAIAPQAHKTCFSQPKIEP